MAVVVAVVVAFVCFCAVAVVVGVVAAGVDFCLVDVVVTVVVGFCVGAAADVCRGSYFNEITVWNYI